MPAGMVVDEGRAQGRGRAGRASRSESGDADCRDPVVSGSLRAAVAGSRRAAAAPRPEANLSPPLSGRPAWTQSAGCALDHPRSCH